MTTYTEKQKAYYKRLQGVDWWACMSDDGRVAREGEAHEREVRNAGKNDRELAGMYHTYKAWVEIGRKDPDPYAGILDD